MVQCNIFFFAIVGRSSALGLDLLFGRRHLCHHVLGLIFLGRFLGHHFDDLLLFGVFGALGITMAEVEFIKALSV
jgi:hypothetical protein